MNQLINYSIKMSKAQKIFFVRQISIICLNNNEVKLIAHSD